MRGARWALTLHVLVGCASGAHEPASSDSSAQECSVRLPPRGATPLAASAPARPAPASQLVVHAEMSLSPLRQTLEKRIQQRLAQGRVGIGPGGTITYSVDRGALSVSVSRNALVVETPVQARAEACRAARCYASCEPQALVRAEVPLLLRKDYRFEKASVAARFTRGCKVRALGGLLTLDVTPTLEAQLEPELQKVAREIDEQLPNLTAEVGKAWNELAKTHDLPLGACLTLQPFGVVQGPLSASTQVLEARFAVLATPELRAPCGDARPTIALPPLQTDLSLPAEGLVHLGLVTPLSSIARAFETAKPSAASGKSFRTSHAEVASDGDKIAAELTLAGNVCGDLALGASLTFGADSGSIELSNPTVSEAERERLKDSGLEPRELTMALAAAPRVEPLLSVSTFQQTVPALAAALSRPSVDVSAKVSSARPAGAMTRGEELVAWIQIHGGLRLRQE